VFWISSRLSVTLWMPRTAAPRSSTASPVQGSRLFLCADHLELQPARVIELHELLPEALSDLVRGRSVLAEAPVPQSIESGGTLRTGPLDLTGALASGQADFLHGKVVKMVPPRPILSP